jgi:peptidoglycan/LPS O-acetylase OafA/YrhL
MKHFRSIDGLRAWLAWSVLLYHMILLSAADQWKPILGYADVLGQIPVPCFIIISGFVITHLLLEKHERYLPYITRRFLRIYPLYFCCLIFGIFATYLHFAAFADMPWGSYIPQPEILNAEIAGSSGPALGWHLLSHFTMTHGMISNNVLPMSQYMFLGPAWSLSLEWQFYLLAPLIVFGLRTQSGRILLTLVTLAGLVAFQRGYLGSFYDPSFLPGAGLYFAAGIATRVLYPKLPTLSAYPLVGVLLAGGLVILARPLLPFFLWFAFIAWLRVVNPSDAVSHTIDRALNIAFNSKTARYLGTRSYSTYLIHEPIIHIFVYLCIKQFALGIASTVAIMFIVVPLVTLGASIVLYKFVEAPAIEFGKKLFNDADLAKAPLDGVERV